MRRRLGLPVFCALIFGLIAGCGSDAPTREFEEVTGKVSYKGVPLKMGTVIFQPASGPFASGEIQSDGTYHLKGEIGPNTITIISRDPADPSLPFVPGNSPITKSHIPERYDTREAGLKFDVKVGENTANFDLED